MEEVKFSSWVDQLVETFSSLSCEEQTLTLNQLIAKCGSEQLWHLQHKLPDFLYRDFVSLLPPELTEKILSYLPPEGLLACCQVSRLWKERVGGLQTLWLTQAKRVGCNTTVRGEEEVDWRVKCVGGLRVKRLLDK